MNYPLTCNKKKVEDEYNATARIAGRAEGSSGLGKRIRWNNLATPLESREAAEEWIDDHDDGWYDQLAVTYYNYRNVDISSATLRDLAKRLRAEQEKVKNLKKEYSLCEKATKEKLKKKASVRWLVKVEWHE